MCKFSNHQSGNKWDGICTHIQGLSPIALTIKLPTFDMRRM
jgi:hypothetical protein